MGVNAGADPVSENRVAGARVFAPFMCGKVAVGEGVACRRNQ